MSEEWKDIPDYEGYQVSNMGNVRSLNYGQTGKVRVLKPVKFKCGYLYVNLCKDGDRKHYRVHRLVAQAFLPNPDNLPQVNHRDENPSNNRVENLEWCDCKYNNNYGTRNQRVSEVRRGMHFSEETKRKISKAQSIPVVQYTREGKLIAIFYGATEAERQTGVAHQNIAKCCKGKLKSAGGYKWEWADR